MAYESRNEDLVAVVIMASGASRRFGKGNKLLMPWGDGLVIDSILQATENIAARVVVTRTVEVAEICRLRNISCILHSLPHKSDTIRLGVQYLKEHAFDYSGIMFATADQPLLTADTIQSLISNYTSDFAQVAIAATVEQNADEISPNSDFAQVPVAAAAEQNADEASLNSDFAQVAVAQETACHREAGHIWRLRCGDTPGNPVIFPPRFENELLALPEGENGRYIIRKNMNLVRYTDIDNPLEMRDIDSVEEYEAIKNSAGL